MIIDNDRILEQIAPQILYNVNLISGIDGEFFEKAEYTIKTLKERLEKNDEPRFVFILEWDDNNIIVKIDTATHYTALNNIVDPDYINASILKDDFISGRITFKEYNNAMKLLQCKEDIV